MSKAIVFNDYGSVDVFQYQDVPDGAPKENEVLISHTAIGVNFIDIYNRTGLYPVEGEPKICGVEAVGVVEKVGKNVTHLTPGDRVCYATAPAGAYRKKRVIDAKYLVDVPPEIDDKTVAAILLKGLTAHFLSNQTFYMQPEMKVLIHAAAGNVGRFLTNLCKARGAFVIGTVGSEEKKAIAKANGCDVVINYTVEDFSQVVNDLTKGEGINVVYDSVGKDTFFKSIDCLMKLGLMVSFGQASGPIPPFDISLLSKRSLYLTRPSLFHYKENRMDLILSANEVFFQYFEGVLKVDVFKEFPLSEAREAHALLESRSSTGPIILIP